MKIGSLFSGYGGLDLGVQAALGPMKTAWVSDIEPGPSAILAERFPGVPNLGDITQIDWTRVEPVDIIIGGSPCQDLSMAGRRAGMKPGTRSGLWESMFEAIKTIRPRLVVWENVKGALSAPAFSLLEPDERCMGDRPDGPVLRALGRVLGDLSGIGYDAQWTSLRASDVGAPHRRERVFVVAYPASQGWGFSGDATTRETPSRRAPAVTSGHGGALLPTPSASVANDGEGLSTWLARRRAVKEATGANNGMPLSIAVQLLPTLTVGDAKTGFATTSGSPPEKSTHLATQLDVLIEKQVLSPSTAMGFIDWGEYAPAITRWEDILGRPAPAPTEITDQSRRKCNVHGEERRSREELHRMREATDEETIRERSARGQGSVHEADSLLPGVREHQGGGRKGHASLASEETPKGELPGVRISERPARPSHGQEPGEQRSGEPDDTVRVMPPETPLAGGSSEKAGSEPVGETCICKHRLSAKFVEFLMGLPEGWVTDIEISRAKQLRALGNGVVPQQAALAVTHLLERIK